MEPIEVVRSFITAIENKDLDKALELAADNIEYDNVPLEPVFGREGIKNFLGPMIDAADEVVWVIHREAVNGSTVFTERSDRFKMGGRWMDIPAAGVFEVRDGLIELWRDYFDMPTVMNQLAPPD